MSNVIAFLERMGQDAQLRHASQSDVELALSRVKIDPELHSAILAKDQKQLEMLLGGSSAVCCMQEPWCEPEEDQRSLEKCA